MIVDRSRAPWLVAFFTAIATLLAFWHLGATSVWYDEAASVGYASLPFSQLLPALGHADAFFGLYYGLLHFVVARNSNEVAIRALSAVAAVAFVPAVAYLANQLSGWRASVAAAFIASISPLLLRTAHEARPYSLLVLVSTLMTIAFLSALERPRPPAFALYAVLSILGCYLHLFAIFLVLAHLVWASVYRRSLFRSGLGLTVVAIVVAIVPLVVVIFAPHNGAVNAFIVRPGLRTLLTFLADIAGSFSLLAIEIMIVVAAVLIASRAQRGLEDRDVLILATAFFPAIVVFAISLVRPMLETRYLDESYPGFVVLVAICLARLPWRAGLIVAAVVLLAAVPALRKAERPIEDWRGAAAYVAAHARPGDTIALYPSFEFKSYDYYARRTTPPLPAAALLPYPNQPGARASVAQLAAPRVWLISATLFDTSPRALGRERYVLDYLHAYYRALPRDTATFAGDLRVEAFRR